MLKLVLYLITLRYVDNSFAGEDTVLWRPANGGEPALAHGAPGLDPSPLHDANETKVMIAAVNKAPDQFSSIG